MSNLDDALAHFKAATVSVDQYLAKIDARGTYDYKNTELYKGMISLEKAADEVPVVTPPPVVEPPPVVVPPVNEVVYWQGTKVADYGVGGGGGFYNSGSGTATDSAGGILAKIATPSSPTAGVRGFRWAELRAHKDTICESTLTIPVWYTQNGGSQFWNLFEYKSRQGYPPGTGRIDPIWAVYVDNATKRLMLGWGWGGTVCSGPKATDGVGGKWFKHSGATVPVGKPFTIRCRLVQSNAFDGRITLWQDGQLLIDLTQIRTSYTVSGYNSWNCNDEFAVCHYSDGLSPSPASITIGPTKIIQGG